MAFLAGATVVFVIDPDFAQENLLLTIDFVRCARLRYFTRTTLGGVLGMALCTKNPKLDCGS